MEKKIQKKVSFLGKLKEDMKRNWILYLMLIPVVIYFLVFHYKPMYGVILAFKNYKLKLGITDSPWVGLKHFRRFFSSYNFGNLMKNTLGISVYSLLVGFPIPIIFALLLNHLTNFRLKKTVQMVSYAPHFISTVVICGMIQIFTNVDTGVFNTLLNFIGLDSIDFLGKPEYFKSIYVWTGVWQGMGWSSIIYVSALSGVDYGLHEAAIVDGANKLQRIWHIDLPSIKPTISMLLILQMGSLMSVGFEKVYLLQNDLNKSASSIISTYVYEIGLLDNDYGYSTAINMFNTVINLFLLIAANKITKKLTDESLF